MNLSLTGYRSNGWAGDLSQLAVRERVESGVRPSPGTGDDDRKAAVHISVEDVVDANRAGQRAGPAPQDNLVRECCVALTLPFPFLYVPAK